MTFNSHGIGEGKYLWIQEFSNKQTIKIVANGNEVKATETYVEGGQKIEVVEENSEVSLGKVDIFDTHENHTLIVLALL